MSKIAVLIVDDEEADRYILKRQLNKTEQISKIFEEADGQAAIEFFTAYEQHRTADPDHYPPLIVFLDINMPRLNGHEFLEAFEQIRKENDLASVVVMMFSSSERGDDIDQALRHEFVADYLVKGQFSVSDLQHKIQAVL